MAKITIDVATAKSWLHDIFVAGGAGVTPKRAIDMQEYPYMYGGRASSWDRREVATAAKIIVEAIQFRHTDIKDFGRYDAALSTLGRYPFAPTLTDISNRGIRRGDATLAKFVAWFCAEYEYWWDDSNISTFELDQIKQSVLGKALFDFECFMSQPGTNNNSTSNTNNKTTNGNATRNARGSSSYKTSGGQSGQARALIGQPGVKEYITGSTYWIKGIKADSNNTQCAFVRPLVPAGAAGSVNRVFVGDPSGNKDCRVFFGNEQTAIDFLNKCQTNNKVAANISNLNVVRTNADQNGYFQVDTEFGPVYIKASKLNEEIEEDFELEDKQTEKKPSNKEKWERYEEAYFHEF